MTIHKLLTKGLTFACGLALMAGLSQRALADGTDSGTNITNLAVVNYQVGGVSQDLIESSAAGNNVAGAGNGVSTDFLVDNKVDLTVATVDTAAVGVAPGATDQVLTFTVTNDGNTVQDYVLTATALAGGTGAFGGTDNFDMTGVSIFVEDGTNPGVYNATEDTATFIDELAKDATVTVYIVSDVPAAQPNDDIASYHLLATTHDGGLAGQGLVTSATAGADTAGVDVVFADEATLATGTDPSDAQRDGQHSSQDDYIVATALLTVTKDSTVISDPFNLTTNPKRIPGAIVEYEITIENDAGASATATSIAITDDLDSEVTGGTLAFSLAQYGAQAAGEDIEFVHSVGGTTILSSANDTDDGQIVSNIVTVDNISLAPGENAIVRFRVEVQ